MYAFLGSKPHADDEVINAGYGLGYGNVCSQGQVHMHLGVFGTRDTDTCKWLHPIVDNADLDASNVAEGLSSASDNNTPLDIHATTTPRRGRGRPRVNSLRDESAVEVHASLPPHYLRADLSRNVGPRCEKPSARTKSEKIVPTPRKEGGVTMCCKSFLTSPWTSRHSSKLRLTPTY